MCDSYGYDSQASLDWLIDDSYDSRPRWAGADTQTDCPACGGDGCNWDTYPNAEGVSELCKTCKGTGAVNG
jgi:DnaJ-class molecular chaperone